jgi:GrpB-like predicted nucleotidyltransferase (UPF0157 family)
MNDFRPYRVEEYDTEWKALFQEQAAKIKAVLGDNVLAIDHVGSTSIPGMVAKPNIDIMVTVPDITKITAYREKMENIGFIAHGDYSNISEEYFTEDLPSGERVTSVHVFQVGNPEIKRHLDFRNYLRANDVARESYIKLKRELYANHANHYRAYDNGKHALIERLNQEAHEWANTISSNS